MVRIQRRMRAHFMVVIGSPKDNNINFVSEGLCTKFVRLGQDTSLSKF